MERKYIEDRIKEIESIIASQNQTSQQIINNILMLHGAKQELEVCLKIIDSAIIQDYQQPVGQCNEAMQ